ncbi:MULTISPECIES: FxLYD domain-containing protein [unclassified Streptomyces]|uniref:FxLYD domain-containing protein n=1 Tax=unclassified Streptomyces TaxID=2593676 RepID=UPI0033B08D5B
MQQRDGIRGPVRLILAVCVGAALAAQLTACSDDSSPSGTASKAASAASRAASAVSQAASAATQAGDALASATAEAGRKYDEFKGGVDAKSEVKLGGTASPDSDGRATVKVTATNPTSAAKSYVVQVDFRDQSGNLLDTTVVTVSDVAGGGSKDATARSNRSLTGDVRTDVARAARH